MLSRSIRNPKLARRLFAVESPRVFYLVIPKCGCTFVKNVLWFVANGEFYHTPLRIHDVDDLFLRAPDVEPDLANVYGAPGAFTVLRSPVDRFLSLYFDKVIGDGRREYVPLYDVLVRKRSLIPDPSTLRDHQYNLECMAEWVAENLHTGVDLRPESHWTPQSYRANIMEEFDLAVLTVDHLTAGLELILSECIPNTREVLFNTEMNRSARDFRKGEVVNESIRRLVNAAYSKDRAMYRSAKVLWKERGGLAHVGYSLPRFSDLRL
jgi:hypothetical protein